MFVDLIKKVLRPFRRLLNHTFRVEWRRIRRYFIWDATIFVHSRKADMETVLAPIIVDYHVIEKGLTMPDRRLGFGQETVKRLIGRIDHFEQIFGSENGQWRHAVGVVRAYVELHKAEGYHFEDGVFSALLERFNLRYDNLLVCRQAHISKKNFYSFCKSSFDEFARSRHTVRHYLNVPIDNGRIKAAVELAMTAPSACNRQHARVRCVTDKSLMKKILGIQGGSRGFGHFADKLLVVSADLRDCLGAYERNDGYINGGIFLMNLCHALHFHGIAHCILSCSLELDKVECLRTVLDMPGNEVLVAMVLCGEAPDEFDVATSPRREVNEVLQFV